MKKLLYSLLVLLITSPAIGQEFKKIVKNKAKFTEEYFVLRENQSLKQGSYLKTYGYLTNPTYVLEIGRYDNNMKSGKWLNFYAEPSNSLESAGFSQEGKKEGEWKYFYPFKSKNNSVLFSLGIGKRTFLIDNKNSKREKEVEFDSVGQHIMAKGIYINDNKFGVWEYYSNSGLILNKYDHSSKKMIVNQIYDEQNPFIVFLGGKDRFSTLFVLLLQNDQTTVNVDSQVSFVLETINDSVVYKLTDARGSSNYKNKIVQILHTIPNDWIILDSLSHKKFQIKSSSITIMDESRTGTMDNLDFNVID